MIEPAEAAAVGAIDFSVGLEMLRRLGDPVQAGEALPRLFAPPGQT